MNLSKLQGAASVAGERRSELFYGGARDVVLRKTCEMAADAARSLGDGGTVLYINVLSSEARLEHDLQNVCRARGGAETRRRVLAMTVKPDDLLSHAKFIEKTIESHRVQLVVLNAYEFAAMMPRRRMRLVAFLQQLRDFSNVDIAVGLRREPAESDTGSYAALAYQATAVAALSDMEQFSITAESEEIATDTNEAAWSAPVLRPYALQIGPLKTNDLAGPSDTPARNYAAAA